MTAQKARASAATKGAASHLLRADPRPLLGITGLATDYAKSVLVKRRREIAIDSAAWPPSSARSTSSHDGKKTQAQAIAEGEAEGNAYLGASRCGSWTPRSTA